MEMRVEKVKALYPTLPSSLASEQPDLWRTELPRALLGLQGPDELE